MPFEPEGRVLELGSARETTQRLLDRFPRTRITGLDSSSEIVCKAASSAGKNSLGESKTPCPRSVEPRPRSAQAFTTWTTTASTSFSGASEQSRSLVISDIVEVPRQRRYTIEEGGTTPRLRG